jgi:hypothetical protein
MSDQPKTGPTIWERSTIVRFFRWLFSWRGMRRVFIVLAWTVTIIALWYGEENWRGRRAWNQYRNAVEARGESLDFASYIPKPVPDDENFAATPFLKKFPDTNYNILTNDLYARAADHISETNIAKALGHRHLTDLVAWQTASAALQSGGLKRTQKFETEKTGLEERATAAEAVLEGMKPDEAVFAELRAASSRPYSRYPLFYDLENPWGIMLRHLAKIKGLCQRLKLEACAELAAGRSDQALADVKLTLALADSVKTEPFLISSLVRLANLQIAIQPVWEGLAERRWTDTQLQELQTRFLSYNFLADMQQPLQEERTCGALGVDMVKKQGLVFLEDLSNGDPRSPFQKLAFALIRRLMPSGWYDQEKLNYVTLFDAEMSGVVDLAARKVSPSAAALNGNELNRQLGRESVQRGSLDVGHGPPPLKALLQHRLIASMLLSDMSNMSAKFASAQVACDQAALACALERYRLANGQFPETLTALTPKFMFREPNDVVTGQPYKYRRTEDGQFVLYSVGWNEKDDGGVPGKSLFDTKEGDWVWEYPGK